MIWDRYGMPEHIRTHSRLVRDVALLIVDWLAVVDILLARPVVEAGALLHDLAKARCLTAGRHDLEGQRLAEEAGYPELGYLIGVHVSLPEPHPVDEALVVFYADKRVKHDRIVSLAERYDDIEARYGADPERLAAIRQTRARAQTVEQDLFKLLQGTHQPEDLDDALG